MNEDPLVERVCQIVADVTLSHQGRVGAGASASSVEGWDSLGQVNIVAAVESEFGVTFDARELSVLDSVPKLVEALRNAGVRSE